MQRIVKAKETDFTFLRSVVFLSCIVKSKFKSKNVYLSKGENKRSAIISSFVLFCNFLF